MSVAADPFRLGYTVLASMFLRVSPGELEHVIDVLVAWQEVVYVSSCTGRVDVYIQVVCRSHEPRIAASNSCCVGSTRDIASEVIGRASQIFRAPAAVTARLRSGSRPDSFERAYAVRSSAETVWRAAVPA